VNEVGRTKAAWPRPSPGTIAGVLAAVVAIAVLLPGVPAQAHAVLVRADPSDGAVLAVAPSAVRLAFNEPVSVIGPGLRVFAVDGTRVDLARPPERADVDTADRSVLAVALPDDLPDGGYVVAWRVRSADGHAVSGTLRFTVGDAPPVPTDVAAVLADTDAPTWLRALDRTVRGVVLIGLLLAAGAAVAGLAVARTGAQRRDADRVTAAAATGTLLLLPAALWLQGAVRAGGAGWAGVSGALAGGAELPAAALRAVGLLLLVVLARTALARTERAGPAHAHAALDGAPRVRAALVIPAAALALLPLATEGHQRSVGGAGSLRALLPGLDAVHVSAGALWLGAVMLLALAVRSREGTPSETEALAVRVGRTAIAALGVVAIAGTAQAALLLDSASSLVTTAYGVTLTGKVMIVGAAVGAAGAARRRARRGGGWQGARRLLRTEVVLLVATVAITGALVTLPPPVDADATLFTTSAPLGDDLLLDVGVDSGRPGRTELHLYVVEDGALTGRDLDVRATLTSVADDLGPFRIAPLLVEPGHWFAALEPLPAGDWTLEVTVGIDRFTERTTTFTVPLR